MPEWILLVLGLAAAAAAVAWPLLGREGQGPPERVDEADRIRHRAAIEMPGVRADLGRSCKSRPIADDDEVPALQVLRRTGAATGIQDGP